MKNNVNIQSNGVLNGDAVRMELPLAELLMRGRELIRHLHRHGESTWAEWLEDSLEALRSDSHAGIAQLLEGFEGMGSLTDLYLCPEAGHRIPEGRESAVNEKLLITASRVYQAARDLGDFVDIDQVRRSARIKNARLNQVDG